MGLTESGIEHVPWVSSWAQLLSTTLALVILAMLVRERRWMRDTWRGKMVKADALVSRVEQVTARLGPAADKAELAAAKAEIAAREAHQLLSLRRRHEELDSRQKEDALDALAEVKTVAQEAKQTVALVKQSVAPWDGTVDRRADGGPASSPKLAPLVPPPATSAPAQPKPPKETGP